MQCLHLEKKMPPYGFKIREKLEDFVYFHV